MGAAQSNKEKKLGACRSLYGFNAAESYAKTCIGKATRARWGAFEGPERKLAQGHLALVQKIWAPPSAGNAPSPLASDLFIQRPRGRPPKRPREMSTEAQIVQPPTMVTRMTLQTDSMWIATWREKPPRPSLQWRICLEWTGGLYLAQRWLFTGKPLR